MEKYKTFTFKKISLTELRKNAKKYAKNETIILVKRSGKDYYDYGTIYDGIGGDIFTGGETFCLSKIKNKDLEEIYEYMGENLFHELSEIVY